MEIFEKILSSAKIKLPIVPSLFQFGGKPVYSGDFVLIFFQYDRIGIIQHIGDSE